jgi:glycosyltransferase involved in cell wall biosynthesis
MAFIGGFAFSPKGTIRARAHPLAAELARLGHEVTIFLPPYDNPADSAREWEQDGVRIRNVKMSFLEKNGSGPHLAKSWRLACSPQLLISLLLEVKRFRGDVIHVFKPKGFAGAAGSYFLLSGARNVVLDCDDWEGWGGWNDVKEYPWAVKEYIDRQERWMMRHAPAVTVASRVLEQRAAGLRGGKNHTYYVPNCGPSTGNQKFMAAVRSRSQRETRGDLGLPDAVTILYSGHFEPGEDASFFCRSVAPIANRHNANVVFVGGGPHVQDVRHFFAECPHAKLFFFPQVPYEQFLRVIWAADVAAFPYPDDAVHRAKCSARIVDYMAMSSTVLTSAVGQNLEYIVNGESGILSPPGDEKQFAENLDMLLRHPELRERLGENAHNRIRSKFRWDGDPLQQCLSAYESVLHR